MLWKWQDDEELNRYRIERFKIELDHLKSALEKMNFEAIHRAVDLLSALAQTDRVKTVVKNRSKHMLLFEYEKANALDLFGNRHSCVGRNPAKNACRLDSRVRGKDAFGDFEQVYGSNRSH